MQDVIYLIGQALDVAVEARFPVLKAFLAFGLTSAPRSDSFAEFVGKRRPGRSFTVNDGRIAAARHHLLHAMRL